MTIDREELTTAIELVEQIQVSAEEERKKICGCVHNIKEIEAEVMLRRRTLVKFEGLIIDKCEEIFKLVRSELK